ncbi:MAG: aldo/keto reductase [Acidobacteriia bacterium]|nr:aldo/keto reductase [Terriglobia bacterium]
MRYRLLGNSGLRVSDLCLGTMTFGEEWGWGSAKDESRKIYDRYREAGGNFIDTANVYTAGTSETFLGEFMEGHRQEIVLATKYTNAWPGRDPNAAGNHRKSMVQAVEASLKRLRTDYIDLYLLHIWDRMTPVEEVMRAFDDLVRQGKVIYPAVSDMPAWLVARANTIAELRGWSPFINLQIEYSLVQRTVERDLLPMAHALGLGVTAWSPLAGGLLTGKYAKGLEAAGDSRFAAPMMKERYSEDQRKAGIVSAVAQVAADIGRSPAQVALAWLLSQDVIPIIGARRMSQFEDNLAAVTATLSAEHLRQLEEVSRVELGFPHDFVNSDFVKNLTTAGHHAAIAGA